MYVERRKMVTAMGGLSLAYHAVAFSHNILPCVYGLIARKNSTGAPHCLRLGWIFFSCAGKIQFRTLCVCVSIVLYFLTAGGRGND